MSSPNPPIEDDAAPETPAPESPETPDTPVTPAEEDNVQVTPQPAPEHGRARAKTGPKKVEPTLLHDFFKGRPSPARIAADRKRRMSLEAVKAELRHEMKQSAVKRIQPPGGVKDRVKKWQKANAAAALDTPNDAATEPPDVAFNNEDFQSVTEEDRVRIKMRKKPKPAKVRQPQAATKTKEPPPEEPAKPPPKKELSATSTGERTASGECPRTSRTHLQLHPLFPKTSP